MRQLVLYVLYIVRVVTQSFNGLVDCRIFHKNYLAWVELKFINVNNKENLNLFNKSGIFIKAFNTFSKFSIKTINFLANKQLKVCF